MAAVSSWTSRCGRKDSISPAVASGEAALTSRPGRLRWIERDMAWRYMRGERDTSTRVMDRSVPAPARTTGLGDGRWAEGCKKPCPMGPGHAKFGERPFHAL